MTEHYHVSQLFLNVLEDTEGRARATVRNKPPTPDMDGREDIPPAAVPRFTDKEIVQAVFTAARGPDGIQAGTAPTVLLGRSAEMKGDISTGPGNTGGLSGIGTYEAGPIVEWWPDIQSHSGKTDTMVWEPAEPVPWPDGDVLHAHGFWVEDNDENNDFQAQIRLYWRHV